MARSKSGIRTFHVADLHLLDFSIYVVFKLKFEMINLFVVLVCIT